MRRLALPLILGLALSLSACTTSRIAEVPRVPPAPSPSKSAPAPSISNPTPTPVTVSCGQLLDSKTVADFKARKYVLVDDEQYRQNVAADENSTMGQFVRNEGLACIWGPPNSEAVVMYGYSAITQADSEGKQQQLRKRDDFTESSVDGPSKSHTRYTNATTGETYAFGSGYWAYALDHLDASVMKQLIEKAPAF